MFCSAVRDLLCLQLKFKVWDLSDHYQVRKHPLNSSRMIRSHIWQHHLAITVPSFAVKYILFILPQLILLSNSDFFKRKCFVWFIRIWYQLRVALVLIVRRWINMWIIWVKRILVLPLNIPKCFNRWFQYRTSKSRQSCFNTCVVWNASKFLSTVCWKWSKLLNYSSALPHSLFELVIYNGYE